ncbi:hypothetical protein FKW77_006960 [Venturia effusa]|uniref:Cytochrome P450 monooxygenase n=1 Tax=Venturia effusa TaxID=50376 RepID=A0A517L5N8_9PEZI|nr:hypothetical protein FKW77_006960 [Venturia effusa]
MEHGNGLSDSFAVMFFRLLWSYGYLGAIAWIVVQQILRPIFFSPLSKYPGPFLASFSHLWQLNVDRQRRRHLVYLAAHQKYGKVFRDGPNSLSFCDGNAMQKIYGTGKNAFARSGVGVFPTPGIDPQHPPVFQSVPAEVHTRSRRMVKKAYDMSSILSMEGQIDAVVLALQRKLDEEVANERFFDLTRWINYFTLDALSDLAHGQAFGMLETGQDVHQIMAGLQEGHMFFAILAAYPWISKILFSTPLRHVFKLPENNGLGLVMKMANNIIEHRYCHGSEKKDLLGAFIEAKSPDGEMITGSQVLGEVVATLVAGADTTANSICGIIGFLLQQPHTLIKLQQEIDNAYRQGLLSYPVPTYTECAKLPYLDAVVCEALRLAPSVGGVFTRTIPAEGAEILPGQRVPGGTTVGVNNWVFGRDEEVFGADAAMFKPERWLDVTTRKKLKEYDFAFGHGSRM